MAIRLHGASSLLAALVKILFMVSVFAMPLASIPDLDGAAAVGDDAGPPRARTARTSALIKRLWGITRFLADALGIIAKKD